MCLPKTHCIKTIKKKNHIKFRSFRVLKITCYFSSNSCKLGYSYTYTTTQLYSSTSRKQNVHNFSYHLFMCSGFAVIYRKYMRGFVKPKRLNERGETCQAQMISLKVVWRFVVLSFSNSYLFYSP